jgi:hypothetical protein
LNTRLGITQRQSRSIEKKNPNGISHITMKKKMVHELPIPLTHAILVHHNGVPLPEVIHYKNLS